MPFEGFPLDVGWIHELPEDLREHARELIDGFSTASMWLKIAIEERPDEEHVHQQGHLLLGLANMLVDGSLRIAQIESAKAGERGINAEILETVQHSMLSALLLSGIRFGQTHAEAFLEYDPADFAELLETLTDLPEGDEDGPGA